MMKISKKFLLAPVLIGLLFVASCADDDEVAIDDPVLTLTESSANADRGAQVTINGTVTAAGGFAEITSNTTTGLTINQPQSGETGQQNWSATFSIPADAAMGSTVSITFQASDDLGQESSELTFTITVSDVMDATPPTIAFTDFENEADTTFNQGAELTISFDVTKDDRVAFGNIRVIENIEGDITSSLEDISGESGPMVDVQVTISDFQDNVRLSFSVIDELGNESDTVQINYEVLSPTGNTFLIDEFVVGSTTVQRVRGDIDEDVTFSSMNDYYLVGEVRVDEGATLTIQPGTTIYAESGENVELRIEGVISAEGASDNPIVMTSGAALEGGTQEPGDWIGLRINGAPEFNSGTIRYVRIEYGGTDNAGLRLQDVDESTTVEFVQVFRGSEEEPGLEIRGGTVNLKYIVITDAAGIAFNIRAGDEEYTGDLQFMLINTSAFTEKEDEDFETSSSPSFRIANLTMVGPGAVEGNFSAMRLRNFAEDAYQIYNAVIAEYPDDGIRIDYSVEDPEYFNNIVSNSYIFQIRDQPTRTDFDDPVTDDPTLLIFETDAGTFSNVIDAGNTPPAAMGIGVNSFIPNSSIPSTFDPTTLGPNFLEGSFAGAFDGTTDWTLGWTLNSDGSVRE